MNELVVGQKLWYVPSSRNLGSAREVVISKIGRKYVTTGKGWEEKKFDMATLLSGDPDRYGGRCYVDRERYELEQAIAQAWSELQRRLMHEYRPPAGMTLEKIQAIEKLLEEPK